MDVVISDLDGTLLDHHTYAFEDALPGLELLKAKKIPLVLCSSKTRSEVEYWRARIGNGSPFIAENGGATYVPERCFPFPIRGGVRQSGYVVMVLGTPYPQLVQCLAEASAGTGCRVRGFHAMTAEEIGFHCGLSRDMAELAKKREFDEPFLALDPGKTDSLVAAIEAAGRRHTQGGRFHHIMGNNDKAAAVQGLLELYRRVDPELRVTGIGDGLNDAPFLNVVDRPILIRTPWVAELQAAVPRGAPTAATGPRGWNEAILRLFP